MWEGSGSDTEATFMRFVLSALGFSSHEPSLTSPPHTINIARIQKRTYTLILSAPATLPSLSTVHERFHNVLEISDTEAISHFIRIYSGDFPWIKLNTLIVEGHKVHDISDTELDIWDEYVATFQDHESFFEKGEDIPADCARAAVNDVVLCAAAGDFRWGLEGVYEVLKKFGRKNLTLGYFHDQLLYEVKIVMEDEVSERRTRCKECGSIYVKIDKTREDVQDVEDDEDDENDEIVKDVDDVTE